jgi:aspartate/methionine/tyrosine aminotransferase
VTHAVGDFLITQWLFSTAGGKYDIDLAESCAQVQSAADVVIDRDLRLDYSPDRGQVETRQAVADLYAGACGPDGVVVTHGGQEALYLFYRTFLSPGAHVITTVPGWQQSWEVPRAAGCSVTELVWRPGDPFDTEALREALRPETSLVILCSPGNPSGCMLTDDEWTSILAILDGAGVWLLSDEEFLADLSTSTIRRYPRCLSVSSLSKMYGLPGLRMGWAATASAEGRAAIERMINYKRYTSIANSPICEQIALDVLSDLGSQQNRYQSLLRDGAELLTKFAALHSGVISVVPPQGTPFAWVQLDAAISSFTLARRLLDEYRVLIMPGEVFATEHGFRLTYARPTDVLSAGLDRLGDLLEKVRLRPT